MLQLVRVLFLHISKCSHIQVVLWVHLPIPANNNNANTNNNSIGSVSALIQQDHRDAIVGTACRIMPNPYNLLCEEARTAVLKVLQHPADVYVGSQMNRALTVERAFLSNSFASPFSLWPRVRGLRPALRWIHSGLMQRHISQHTTSHIAYPECRDS